MWLAANEETKVEVFSEMEEWGIGIGFRFDKGFSFKVVEDS